MGIGIPRSQSKMYPVAPASFILSVTRILDILRKVMGSELFVYAGTCFDYWNAQSGRWMSV
jgi:hypothetical protein